MLPETVALFLACARLGAVVCPLFSGYGAGAIVARLADCRARVLCVADGFLRRGQVVATKATADEAAAQLPSCATCWWSAASASAPTPRCARAATTGTTSSAPPQGEDVPTARHRSRRHADAHLHQRHHRPAQGHRARPRRLPGQGDAGHGPLLRRRAPSDRLLWFTDLGWMMGPWAICGALTIGATLVLFEGVPDHPGPDRLWQVAADHEVTVLGIAPTVVRALMRHGDEPVRAHDLSRAARARLQRRALEPRPLALVPREGRRRPLPDHQLLRRHRDRAAASSPATCSRPLNPCAFSRPCPGMDADVVDEDGSRCAARSASWWCARPGRA